MLANKTEFAERCERLFAGKLGYDRRWKTAAAQALGIGRATLYRYLDGKTDVAGHVIQRLDQLESGGNPICEDRQMLTLIARGLLDLQREMDENGWLKNGFPDNLQRVFDLASARNALEDKPRWPTDLIALSRFGQMLLYDSGIDVSWDPNGEFADAKLLDGGEITPACIALSMPGRDPEAEFTENSGYTLLKGICRERPDGQAVYVAFRRAIIEHPILSGWTTLLTDPLLVSIERLDEIIFAFYERVPESLAIDGFLPVCSVSGTILRRERTGFHTESRDPDAIRKAKASDYTKVKWRPGALQLRRPFRIYWNLPGRAELALEREVQAVGWKVDLWPNLDRVDLVVTSGDGKRQVAIDVKEYLSPENLAVRFQGFKEYAANHECYLVVPDHIPEISNGYHRRFASVRASYSKTPVKLRTVSELLNELKKTS
jgi:hypothetical protein